MDWIQVLSFLLVLVAGSLIGYALGVRRARKLKKRVMQQVNRQSLELLESKSETTKLQSLVEQHKPKEVLLRSTLVKLTNANAEIRKLQEQNESDSKKHFVQAAKMRLQAVEAQQSARKATSIALRASAHLKRLEDATPATQTIEAHEPKSYGTGDPVTVKVVDQAHVDRQDELVAKVSNRDSARLTRLMSSNEAKAN